jgi:hypothetical protein
VPLQQFVDLGFELLVEVGAFGRGDPGNLPGFFQNKLEGFCVLLVHRSLRAPQYEIFLTAERQAVLWLSLCDAQKPEAQRLGLYLV